MSRLLFQKANTIYKMQGSRCMVSDPKYGFLKELGLTTENPGLFDGRWGGSGKVCIQIHLCVE